MPKLIVQTGVRNEARLPRVDMGRTAHPGPLEVRQLRHDRPHASPGQQAHGPAVLSMAQPLQLYAIVTGSRVPGRDRLLAALDREIDNHPRPTTEDPA